jgi:hypothetical protein
MEHRDAFQLFIGGYSEDFANERTVLHTKVLLPILSLGLRAKGLGLNERNVLKLKRSSAKKKRFCHWCAAGVLKQEWSLTLSTSCTAQTTSSRRALPTLQCARRRRLNV